MILYENFENMYFEACIKKAITCLQNTIIYNYFYEKKARVTLENFPFR